VIVVAAWMLDPAVCAGMQLGVPRVSVAALVDLHHLLVEGSLRASSTDDSNIVQEKPSDQTAPICANSAAIAADGIASVEHCVRFHPASRDEPDRARESALASGALLDASRARGDGGAR
jgi:hypothetical protein